MAEKVMVTMFNQGEIAELLGVARETVARWKKDTDDPIPVHFDSGGDGAGDQFYPSAVIQWHLRHELKKRLRLK